jgi:FtsP/CotA-like multicopper oxidase with cupredoxin domain
MPDLIPRDVGSDFDPNDPLQVRELDEFMAPPSTLEIYQELISPEPDPTSRALRLFAPALVAGLLIPDPIDEEILIPPLAPPGFLPTPDRVSPDQFQDHRGLHDITLPVPGRAGVPVWSFRDNATGASGWPAPTIRLVEGAVVHSRMSNRGGPHTIHHHGIEPTAANDGVGHLTFDVGGGLVYDYQWLASEAGTFFYHCHVNTVLHFEMGMYGLLIIDAPPPESSSLPVPYQDGGPGWTYLRNNKTFYDKEAFWVADDIDTRWHSPPVATHGHDPDAGIDPGRFMTVNEGPRLHDFNPDVFVVSGVAAPWNPFLGRTESNAEVVLDPVDPNNPARRLGSIITPRVQRGGKLLIRALNASYTTTRWTFPQALRGAAQVIAIDGRTLGREPFGRYSSPFMLSEMSTPYLQLTTAQRWDILLDTSGLASGDHDVTIDYHHWITDALIQRVRTRIIVVP